MESGVSAVPQAPPLIPAPKSFLKRLASLTKSSSSRSSYRLGPTPSPPPPAPPPPPAAPSQVSINQDHDSGASILPTPQENNIHTSFSSEKQQSSSLQSESSTQITHQSAPLIESSAPITHQSVPLTETTSQEHHFSQPSTTTAPLFPSVSQPPSPLPSYPPSLHSSSPPSSSPTQHFKFPSPPSTPPPPVTPPETDPASTDLSYLTLLSREAKGDDHRTHSTSPSEVMGYLDEAIGDHTISASSVGDALDYRDFSPAFQFSNSNNISEQSTSALPFTRDSSNAIGIEDENVFSSDHVSFVPEQYPDAAISRGNDLISTNSDNIEHKTRIGTQEKEPLRSPYDIYNSGEGIKDNDDPFEEIHNFSPTPREQLKRKLSVSPRKVSVSKLQQDTQTVRQQIKPGSVGELASMFTNMMEEQGTSPSTRDEFHFGQKTQRSDSLTGNHEERSHSATKREWSSSFDHEDISTQFQSSGLNRSSNKMHQHHLTYPLKPPLEINVLQANPVLDKPAPTPDLNVTPSLDYLSASREIFKQVLISRSNSQTNIAKCDNRLDGVTADTYVNTSENKSPSLISTNTPVSSNNRASLVKRDSKLDFGTADKIKYEIADNDNTSVPSSPGVTKLHTAIVDSGDIITGRDVSFPNYSVAATSKRDESEYTRDAQTPANVNIAWSNCLNTDDHKWQATRLHHPGHMGESILDVSQTPVNEEEMVTHFPSKTNIENTIVTEPRQLPLANNKIGNTAGDEVRRMIASKKGEDGSMSRLIGPPQVTSDAEPLQTVFNSENINRSIQFDERHDFPPVNSQDTSFDTPDTAQTGSHLGLHINRGLVSSQFSASKQPVSEPLSDKDLHKFKQKTSSSRHENLMVWTKLDTPASDHVSMSDGDTETSLSPGLLEDCSYNSEEKSVVKNVIAKYSSQVIGHVKSSDKGVSLTRDDDNSFINTAGGSSIYSVNNESIVAESNEPHGYLTRASLLAADVTNAEKKTGDVKQGQINKSLHPNLHRSHKSTKLQTSRLVVEENGDDVLKDIDVSDAASETSINSEFQAAVALLSKKSTNSGPEDVESLTPTQEQPDDFQEQPDDFQTLLDDIQIDTDVTSSFLRSSRRSGRKQRDKRTTSDPEDAIMRVQETDSVVDARKDSVARINLGNGMSDVSLRPAFIEGHSKGTEQVAATDLHVAETTGRLTETSLLGVPESVDFNEEIKKLHDAISPKLSEPAEYDKSLNMDPMVAMSQRSNVGSSYSSRLDSSSLVKETLFDSQFFIQPDTNTAENHRVPSRHGSLNMSAGRSSAAPLHEHDEMPKEEFLKTISGSGGHVEVENVVDVKTSNNELLARHENMNGTAHPSDWIVASDSSRSIPWSEYEGRSQIQFLTAPKDIEKEQNVDPADVTSSPQAVKKEAQRNDSQQHKTKHSVQSKELFTKSESIKSEASRRLSEQESIIMASTVFRSIPWTEYEERLNSDNEGTSRSSYFVNETFSEGTRHTGSRPDSDVSNGEGFHFERSKEASFNSDKIGDKQSLPNEDALIVVTEKSRSIPWSEYEERSKIEFVENSVSNRHAVLKRDLSFEPDSTSSSRANSVHRKGNKNSFNHNSKESSLTRRLLRSEKVAEPTMEGPGRQDSLIVTTLESRSIPWKEYETRSQIEFKENSNIREHKELLKTLKSKPLDRMNSCSSVGSSDSHEKRESEVTLFDSQFFYTPDNEVSGKTSLSDMNPETTATGSSGLGTHVNSLLADITNSRVQDHGWGSASSNDIVQERYKENKTFHVDLYKEEESVEQKEDDSHLFSKEKFQDARKVFERRELENRSQPTHSSAKTNSLKSRVSPSSSVGLIRVSKTEEDGEVSIHEGRNVTSRLETGEHTSRDAYLRGVDLKQRPIRDTGIETSEEEDSSNESTSGSGVDTCGTRARRQKSKQTNIAYDLQTGELLQGSVSRSNSIRSSDSVTGAIIKPASLDTANDNGHSSLETEGLVSSQSKHRTSEIITTRSVFEAHDLTEQGKTSLSSTTSPAKHSQNIPTQISSGDESPESGSEFRSLRESLRKVGVNNFPEDYGDEPRSFVRDTVSANAKRPSLKQTNSVSSPRSSVSSVDISDIISPLPDSLEKNSSDVYGHTNRDNFDFHDGVRRQSTADSGKQDQLIDAFLRSGAGTSSVPESARATLGKEDTSWGTTSRRSLDQKGYESLKKIQQSPYSENHNETFLSERVTSSTKIDRDYYRNTKSDNFEPNFVRSASSDSKNSDNMSAVVGELSSFSIHKKVTTLEESFSVQPEDSHNSTSPREITAAGTDQTGSDIYLIQDNKGDYYALQEVDDDHAGTNVTNVNLHILESSRAQSGYENLNGHMNYNSGDTVNTDLYVDSSAVEDDKAREVISAYLDSQELSRRPQPISSTDAPNTFHKATKHDYSHRNSSDDRAWWSSEADNAGQLFTVTSPTAVTSTNHGSVVVQQHGYQGVTNDTSFQSEDYNISSGSYKHSYIHQHDGLLNNSAVAGYKNNSLDESGYNYRVDTEPDRYTSSLHLTNLNTPQEYRHHSTVVDTAHDTLRSGNYSTSSTQPDSTNHTQHRSAVNPFLTSPITVTTTTQAVVGEQVGMHIDYSPTDAFSSTSDEDSSQKLYVVKNLPHKSSLKKNSRYDSSSLSDSSSDIVFTKGEPLAAGFNHDNTREVILHTQGPSHRQTRSSSHSDSLSPRTVVDGPMYSVYHPPRSYQNSSVSPTDDRGYYKQNRHEMSFSSSREHEGNNLYRVRNLSASMPDGLQHTDSRRRVSRNKSSNYDDNTIQTPRKKHHSPERFFTNPQLSLRKGDYDSNNYSSDEDRENKQFRTVTKVFLNENQPRSVPQSSATLYKLSSSQSQDSLEKTTDHALQNGNINYAVISVKSSDDHPDGSPGFASETDSDNQKKQHKYRVVGTSDSSKDRYDEKVYSSPTRERQRVISHEEATITRTESVQPSRLNNDPPSTKTHKTVIQLDLDDVRVMEAKNSEELDSRYMIKRVMSADDLREARTTVNHLNYSADDSKMWTTGKPRSSGNCRSHSSSDDDDSDFEQKHLHDSRIVKTLKQQDGNKLYVVSSTVSDPNVSNGPVVHSPGWFKSTIDINKNTVEKLQPIDQIVSHKLNQERSDSNSYRTEKTVYFVRETAPQTNVGKVFQRTHSTEFAYPDSGQGTEVASSDGENEMKHKFERVERIYEIRSEPQLPEQFHSMEDLNNDLRVLRGNILIKNRMSDDHDLNDFDENVNLFDNSFHLGKDNPLFSSDQDIMASLKREDEQDISKHVTQDITFESVDRIAHEFNAERQVQVKPAPQRKKQNLSHLLLSKLANVDSKDIRQTIDVEHHNEEIYGDIDFIHADGQRKNSKNTRNFDSVNENVELTLTQGKAYVIIKVVAERIIPTDYEFNVWRKSQAIVTRQIEIDLLANEQRRRLYKHVMASAGVAGSLQDGSRNQFHDSERLSAQERQLSSMETLKLFSQILDVTDGQGDKDFTETRTRQEMGQLPPSAMDLLY